MLHLNKKIYSQPEIKIRGESQSQTIIRALCHLIQSLSSSSIQIRQENKFENIRTKKKIKSLIFFRLSNNHCECIVQ